MIVLVLGSGLAAHAWAWRLAQSKRVQRVYTTARPLHAGWGAANPLQHECVSFENPQHLLAWAQEVKLGLVFAVGDGHDFQSPRATDCTAGAAEPTNTGAVLNASVANQLEALQAAGYKTLGSASAFEEINSQNSDASPALPLHASAVFSLTALCDGATLLPLATTSPVGSLVSAPNPSHAEAAVDSDLQVQSICSPAPAVSPTLFAQALREVLRPAWKALQQSPHDLGQTDGIQKPLRALLHAEIGVYADDAMPPNALPRLGLQRLSYAMPDAAGLALLARLKGDVLELLLAAAHGRLGATEVQWDRRLAVVSKNSSANPPANPPANLESPTPKLQSLFSETGSVGFAQAYASMALAWGDTLKHAQQQSEAALNLMLSGGQ